MGEWRQVFLAALEPQSRVSICEGVLEDALADLDGFLATIVGSPERIWRFHHPRCIGIDADEVALLDILRLVQVGEMEAGAHTLRGLIGPDRTERAMRYLDGVVKSLGQCGLGLPLARSTPSGLDLTH
nr:hypothetical protein [uncultured Dongia sp.]